MFDIAIMGAGLAGLIAAKIASDLGFSVALLEQKSQTDFLNFRDFRTLALNAQAIELFQILDLWDIPDLKYQPILKMFLAYEQGFSNLELSHQEAQLPALAYHIENQDLLQLLYKKLEPLEHQEQHKLTWYWEIQAQAFSQSVSSHTLQTNLGPIQAKLWLATDGSRSWLRQAFGIQAKTQNYEQQAMVAKLQSTEPHQNTAYQKFFKDASAMACLPCQNPNELALVFSGAPNFQKLEEDKNSDANNTRILEFLNQACSGFFGLFYKIEKMQRYPLFNTLAETNAKMPLLLIGDSAQQIHPMAGQGFNLALAQLYEFYKNLNRILKQGYAEKSLNHPGLWRSFALKSSVRAKLWSQSMNAIRYANLNQDKIPLSVVNCLGSKVLSKVQRLKTGMINHANYLPF
ncbi:MAG: FAD-dependent monooxygenase [Gammaproteobacteria bacterium]